MGSAISLSVLMKTRYYHSHRKLCGAERRSHTEAPELFGKMLHQHDERTHDSVRFPPCRLFCLPEKELCKARKAWLWVASRLSLLVVIMTCQLSQQEG